MRGLKLHQTPRCQHQAPDLCMARVFLLNELVKRLSERRCCLEFAARVPNQRFICSYTKRFGASAIYTAQSKECFSHAFNTERKCMPALNAEFPRFMFLLMYMQLRCCRGVQAPCTSSSSSSYSPFSWPVPGSWAGHWLRVKD